MGFYGVIIPTFIKGADMAARTKSAKRNAPAKGTRKTPKSTELQAPPGPRGLYVISDSTGNLPRHMLGAFMTQFPRQALNVRFESFVRTATRLQEILDQARLEKAAVCHAMVSADFKRLISTFCAESRLKCRDLTGGIVEFLSDVAGVEPLHNVDVLHPMDDLYEQRIRAMEFTLTHDDGLGLDSLDEADIVLTGVSRTSKTPTSIYLAQQGYRVANVALAMGVAPPPKMFTLPKNKIVGLVINPAQLQVIRTHRAEEWRMGETNYGDRDHIVRELAWTRKLFSENGWHVIDVTDQGRGISVEDLGAVFDKFYRTKQRDRTVPGTGLGLAICKGIVEAHGGSIEALSPGLGRGTTARPRQRRA